MVNRSRLTTNAQNFHSLTTLARSAKIRQMTAARITTTRRVTFRGGHSRGIATRTSDSLVATLAGRSPSVQLKARFTTERADDFIGGTAPARMAQTTMPIRVLITSAFGHHSVFRSSSAERMNKLSAFWEFSTGKSDGKFHCHKLWSHLLSCFL